jgi:hypothetical protein
MVKRFVAAAAAVVAATAAAVIPSASPAMAVPDACDAPYYSSNWARIQCVGGTGDFAVRVTCLIAASGGHTEEAQGPWKAVRSTVVTNYADCSLFGTASPVRGSARLATRG